jgi:3-hydroxyisobutyrate dehydrogenase-like beta-hydroxyacid dehydrogenase
MAARLAAAGCALTVWNRDPIRCGPLVAAGARAATTPADAAARCDVAVTMLSDAAAVRAVLGGVDGLTAGRPPVLVQMSTIGPDETADLPRLLPAGCTLVDAPVLGSTPDAVAGTLRLLVGGADAAVAHCRPLLGILGEVVHVGPVGAGSALKLVVNAAVAPMVALLAEAAALGDALGLDRGLVLDELARSRIGPLVRRKHARLLDGRYHPADSSLSLHAKDMRLVTAAARRYGVRAQVLTAAADLAAEAVEGGLGEEDYAVLVEYVRGQLRP